MDAHAVGRRIAYWRERRRLTQQDLGHLMGRSRRGVQDLERGERQADPRVSVLEDAARALRIPLVWLLADGPERACVDPVEIEAIRAALQRYDVISGSADDDAAAPDAGALRARVAHGWDSFQAGALVSLGRALPGLIAETSRAAALHTGDGQLAARRALSMTLCLAEAIAIKYGCGEVAYLAGHRAVIEAERSGDVVTMACAARHLADAMAYHGQPDAAAALARAAAARLGPDLERAGTAGLSTLGMLHLKAAYAEATAAGLDTRTAAASARAVPGLLDQADEHAARIGGSTNAVWTAFSAANVALYRLAAHVQLAEGEAGVDVALGMPTEAVLALPRERRAHRLVDLAHAYTLAGRRSAAVDALLDAEREAAQEVRCRPRTRQLVQELGLLPTGAAEGRLRQLAVRCGLPG
ncbi:helix-turn-helix transcriptional regulator [Streptomyces sp. NPDC001034]|uniref:helix-turn-helix domain-containing protein n=1 Tax=Streptomyces sp. NPDC001034 TaxID=3154375 RepID=UPI0033186707